MSEYEDMKGGKLGQGGSKESCATNKSVEGCIGQLIKLAETPFEKQAVIEFATMEAKFKEELASIKANLKWIKYLIVGVFVVIVLNIINGRI